MIQAETHFPAIYSADKELFDIKPSDQTNKILEMGEQFFGIPRLML